MSTENHRVTLKVIILKIIYLKVIYFKENCLSEWMVRTQKHLKKMCLLWKQKEYWPETNVTLLGEKVTN